MSPLEMKIDISYDCLWIQWTLQHLKKDADVLTFLENCSKISRGFIFIKENISYNEPYSLVNPIENTLIRSLSHYRGIFGELRSIQVVEEKTIDEELCGFDLVIFVLKKVD